ncbi:MAG: FliM/FliN family flagellar motor switch protein, partial [Candidatus Brocadiaceae bacterium]
MSTPEEGKLSKEEVETLLEATQQEEEEPVERSEPTRRVHGWDFQQPSRFSKTQLEKLRRINDALAQNATSHASRLLRSNVKTQLVSMDQMKWENLLEEAGDTVVGFVFLMEPLGYRGVAAIDSEFAAVLLERMMGGQADAGEAATLEFTDLDVRVLASFIKGFLEPLPELWSNIGEFDVQLGSFARDLQTVDLFTATDDFVQFCFLMQSSVGSGQISLAVPFQAVRALPPDTDESERSLAGADEAMDAAVRENLKETSVELTVLLGSADIKVGRLVQIEPGDIIVLDSRIGDALRVKVNDKVKL